MQIEIKKNSLRKYGYFNSSEFKFSSFSSENLDSFLLDSKTIIVANYLRLNLGPIVINCCARSPLYNTSVGGVPNSQHLITNTRPVNALDLKPLDLSIPDFKLFVIKNIKILKLLGVRGIGFYNTFIHIDCRKQSDRISYWGSMTDSQIKKINDAGTFLSL